MDSVRIAEVRGDKIAAVKEAEGKFLDMIQHIGSSAILTDDLGPKTFRIYKVKR